MRTSSEQVFGSLRPERARVLLVVALRPAGVVMAVVVALVLATLLAAGSALTGVSGAVAAGWLAVHQVPLEIGRAPLGVLPLLPTALMWWLAARVSAQAVDEDCTTADLGAVVAAALAGPLLVTAVCLAVVEDATAVIPLQPPGAATAFGWVAGLHVSAAGAGIARRLFSLRSGAVLNGGALPALPGPVRPGIRVGCLTVGRLLVAATLVALVSLLVNWSQVAAGYGTAGDAAGGIGLTLLSLAYAPNLIVDVAGALFGVTVQAGVGSVNLFAVSGGPLPPVPVLAVVPAGPAAPWWPALLALPIAVGVWSGLDCARTRWDGSWWQHDRLRAPWVMVTSAAVAAVVLALLAVLAGGVAGTFGALAAPALPVVGLAFLGLCGTGYLGLVGAAVFGLRPARTAPDDDADVDQGDDYRQEQEVTADAERLDDQPALAAAPLRSWGVGPEYLATDAAEVDCESQERDTP